MLAYLQEILMDFNPSTEVNEATLERVRLDHRLNVGASWFFWISGLTLMSSMIANLGNQSFGFIIGLGITQLVDNLGNNVVVTLSFDLLLASLFFFLGRKARKTRGWAFILGIILYGLDSLIFVAVQDYVGLIFHAFVLLGLLGGLQALNLMQSMTSETNTSTAYEGSR
jgi:hypothetical protein